MKTTSVFDANVRAYTEGARIIINQGGSGSSKTTSVLQLIDYIASVKKNETTSIVSQSLPHLKRGAMRQYLDMIQNEGIYSEDSHNKTDHLYRRNNSTIEFFGVEQFQKVKGPRRNHLFVNEANYVSLEAFRQMEIRTSGTIWIDFNPVSMFWAHEQYPEGTPGVKWIRSTYKDNQFLPAEVIRSIETKALTAPEWFRVYGLGEVGSLEGLIFRFNICNDIPAGKLLGYGLDFGYTNDPAALVEVVMFEGQIYLLEYIYEQALTNSDIVDRIRDFGIQGRIVCDSSEPKSVEELNRLFKKYGMKCNAEPCEKGKDSVNHGIQLMQQYLINITSDSTNLIKEFQNYRWAKDKYNDHPLNQPEDTADHGIDAARYLISKVLTRKDARRRRGGMV